MNPAVKPLTTPWKVFFLGLIILLLSGSSATGAQAISSQIGSSSANTGQYSNQIEKLRPAVAYTEICFVKGEVEYDQHDANEQTNGGNCAPSAG